MLFDIIYNVKPCPTPTACFRRRREGPEDQVKGESGVAARIAALAKGGEIMLGPETAGRVKGRYVLEDAGEHRLKNVSESVRVFRLVPPGMYAKVVA